MDVIVVYKELITLSATHLDSEVDNDEGKAKLRVYDSMSALLTVPRIQTLLTGSEEKVMEEDRDRNEDGMQEDVMEMMIDLTEVAGDLLVMNFATKENGDVHVDTDENDGGPFLSLSEFCINVISSPICGNEGARVVVDLLRSFMTVKYV